MKKRTGENEIQQRAGIEKYLTEAAIAGDKDAQRDLAIYNLKQPKILKSDLPYLLAMTQSIQGEDLVSPLKPKHEFALQLLQKAANQNDGEAMRLLAMLTLYQQKSFNVETMSDCIELLQKAHGASDISEKSQIDIKNILCAFKVLASNGLIELKSDEITLVTEEEIQELKKRLEGIPEYANLLKEAQEEEDEGDQETMFFLHSSIEESTEAKEDKKEIVEIKETKELAKEVKTHTLHGTVKETRVLGKKEKNPLLTTLKPRPLRLTFIYHRIINRSLLATKKENYEKVLRKKT